MGLTSSLFGSAPKTPQYIYDLNEQSAKYNMAQMSANQENWGAAQAARDQGAESDFNYGTAAGSWLNSNPYIDQNVANATSQIVKGYNESSIPSLLSSYAASGRYGSGLMQKSLGNMQSQMNQDIGNAANQAYLSNYQNERGYQEAAANRLGQQYDSLNRAQQYGSVVNQGGQAPVSYDLKTPGSTGALGKLGQYTQGAQALAPYATAIGGMLGLSDRRAKEDIKRVGRLDNGLNVYRYRYKGDARPQIGLMAQEVAREKPEAVGMLPGGWMGVAYDLATEE